MSDTVLGQFTQSYEEEKQHAARKLRVGIIGCGWIAEAHAESYKEMDDVEIVALADLIPGKAEAFAKRYGFENVKFYPSHKELIDSEKLDAVSVCTYNTQHAAPTIYALEHGVNVLLEKPFTVTLDEAVEVCRAEKKSGKLLSIGFQPRARYTTFRPAAAAGAAAPTAPLSRRRLRASARWATSAATLWTWC